MDHKISKRNLFVIILMMFVVLFMFMSILVIKDRQNQYDTNDFYAEAVRGKDDMVKPRVLSDTPREGEYVVYIGSDKNATYNTAYYWCFYRKFALVRFDSPSDYIVPDVNQPVMILVDGRALDLNDTDGIDYLKEQGAPVVYCNIPNAYIIQKNPVFMDALGITKVEDMRAEVYGLHLFSGFVLGGNKVYTPEEGLEELMDMETTMVRYRVANDAKVYMVGAYEETPEDTSLQPPIIWRYSTSGGYTFVFNCDFIEDISGMGYLNACLAECRDYDVYSVVNADVLSLVNFPCVAEEDTEEVINTYNRSMQGMFRNLIWPSVIAVNEESAFTLTAFMSMQYNYYDGSEPTEDNLIYYLMQMKEQKSEVGLSFDTVKPVSIPEKIDSDVDFLDRVQNDYEFQMMYTGSEGLSEVIEEYKHHDRLNTFRTVMTDIDQKKGLFDYATDSLLCIRPSSDIVSFKYSDDLKLRGYETALLYSNAFLDVSDSIYPKEPELEWQHVEESFAAVVGTFWKNFKYVDKLTLSQADTRIREFLSVKYKTTETDDGIMIELENFDRENFFILRAAGRSIKDVTGGTFEKIEDGIFLIKADTANVGVSFDVKKRVSIE